MIEEVIATHPAVAEYTVPSTIDDPGVIPEIIEVLRSKKLIA